MRIFPFQPLVPSSDDAAADVTCPHYDALSATHLQSHLISKPHSFMTVMRPDAVLNSPSTTSPQISPPTDQMTSTAIAQSSLQTLQSTRHLHRDATPHLYLYSLQSPNGKVQTGVIATAKISDYDNRETILRHELTRKHKEVACTDFIDTLSAIPGGPVFLTYNDVPTISKLIDFIIHTTDPSLYLPGSLSEDGVTHSIYRVPQSISPTLSRLFDKSVDKTYIADGHHRAASASNVAARRATSQTARFSIALFPQSHLNLSSFTRIVSGKSVSSILSLVRKGTTKLSPMPSPPTGNPTNQRHVHMYYRQQWYDMMLRNGYEDDDDTNKGPAHRLDAALLQNEILRHVVHDKSSTKVKFVSGNVPPEELTKKVDRLAARDGHACAFMLRSATISDVMEVANANQVMPPKSTSFEPKLRCGFFTHTF